MSDAPIDSDVSSAASKEGSEDGPEAITKLTVEGFKSLARETEIEIRPLTLLAGANSSGKSSMMQPLLLLKQTLEAPFDPGPLLLDGPNTSFTSFQQLLHQSNPQRKDLRVGVEGKKYWEEFHFGYHADASLRLLRYSRRAVDDFLGTLEVSLREDTTIEEFVRSTSSSKFPFDKEANVKRLEIHRDRCRYEAKVTASDSSGHGIYGVPIPLLRQDPIEQSIHVPGLRDNPSRTYKTTAVGNRFPGTFDDYVASVIHAWQRDGDERMERLVAQLRHMGLTRDVSAERINDTQVELRVSQSPAGPSSSEHASSESASSESTSSESASGDARMINVADVGIGVSQVLPVLVAMLAAEPGQLVYVEQPEIHLHPRAQAHLADAIVEASNRGVRVVIETHSQLLLLALQTQIAEDQIDPQDVMLHWFTRDDDGITSVSSREPDAKGAFGDWPEDFSEVEMEWQNRYLDAAEKHLFAS